MGALHHGHLSLVDELAGKCDKIIVSIFVNPTQFSQGEDLDAYPRQEKDDIDKLSHHPAGLVFIPTVDEMYPKGDCTVVTLTNTGETDKTGAGITEILEGANRPGHFDGVATVVTKLFQQSQCDIAIFGEKDYQQLAVIRQFTHDLHMPIEIMAGTLVREDDGLAASSRNVYLSKDERKIAAKLNVILSELVISVCGGADLRFAENVATQALLDAGFLSVDYISIVHKDSLQSIDRIEGESRVVAAAHIGNVRLLDNMAIKP